MNALPMNYAIAIICAFEIAFVSFLYFFGDTVGAVHAYGGNLHYPIGFVVWSVIVAFFGGTIPLCFTKYFK